MRIDIYATPNLFIAHGKDVEAVLRRAVRSALMNHKRAGNPIAIWRNGKAQFIRSEEIAIEPIAPSEQT